MRALPCALLTCLLAGCQLLMDPEDIEGPGLPDACVPLTCEADGKRCGTFDDGCGGVASCSSACEAPDTCGGGGTPNVCGREEICTPEGWCWENPLPLGEDLHDAISFAADDVWAVGSSGTLLHWDGLRWRRVETGRRDEFLCVWGTSGDDLWIGARDWLLHWDGREIQPHEVYGWVSDLWGDGAGAVWAAGSAGNLLSWDGKAWKSHAVPEVYDNFYGIWGSAADDVWAVGTNGTIAHYDGEWSLQAHDVRPLQAVWGAAPDDVWAVGEMGLAMHFDGKAWTEVDLHTDADFFAVWGERSDRVWVMARGGGLHHWDGKAWTPLPGLSWPDADYGAITGSAGAGWAVGGRGLLYRLSEGRWSPFSAGTPLWLKAIWGAGPRELWAVGSDDAVVIVKRGADGRWDEQPSGARNGLEAIHGTSATDVWAVGSLGEAVHFDGALWRRAAANHPVNLRAVWAYASREAFAVGDDGLAVRWENGWATEKTGTTRRLLGLWGSGPDDLWAVGMGGTVLRRSATGWAPDGPTLSSDCMLTGVWFASRSDRWLTSDDPKCGFYRWLGSWSRVAIPAESVTFGFSMQPSGSGPDDVWVPRGVSPPLHFDGKVWAPVPTGSNIALDGVWTDGKQVWVAGQNGAILRRDE